MTMLNKGLKPVLYDKDKAVSPIIATILLVAITVILASTLYLALGGFFSHVGTTTPSASVSVTGNTTVSSPSTTSIGEVTYSVTVGSPSATVPLTSTAFSVVLSNGQSATLTYTSSSGSANYETSASISGVTSVVISGASTSGNAVVSTLTLTIEVPLSSPGNVYLTSISYLDTSSSGGGVMGTTSTIG